MRDNVLYVDDDGDEEATTSKRDLRQSPVHEVVDRALNKALSDAERDIVFEAPDEEDDEVGLTNVCRSLLLYRVVQVALLCVHRSSVGGYTKD